MHGYKWPIDCTRTRSVRLADGFFRCHSPAVLQEITALRGHVREIETQLYGYGKSKVQQREEFEALKKKMILELGECDT